MMLDSNFIGIGYALLFCVNKTIYTFTTDTPEKNSLRIPSANK